MDGWPVLLAGVERSRSVDHTFGPAGRLHRDSNNDVTSSTSRTAYNVQHLSFQ